MSFTRNNARVFVQLLRSRRRTILLDIGSTTTRVAIDGRVVFAEPSALAVHTKTRDIIALGAGAYTLLGKTPPSVRIVFPFEAGVVSHPDLAVTYLRGVASRVLGKPSLAELALGRTGWCALPAGVSGAEKNMLQRCLSEAGYAGVELLPRAVAIATHHGVSDSQPACIIDIGGQVTELSVSTGSQILQQERFHWGGVYFTQLLQRVVLHKQQCAVGWHEAQTAKHELSNLEKGKIALRGKDILTQASMTALLDVADFNQVLDEYTEQLLDQLELFFARMSSSLSASILENAVYLSGGGAHMSGVTQKISKRFGVVVYSSGRPAYDAIEGLQAYAKI